MKRFLIAAICLVVLGILGVYIRQVIHETVQMRKPGQQYIVSLGDSVAAGAGLSDNGQKKGCDLSGSAYPYVLAKQLHEQAVQFACSGATVATTSTNSTNTIVDSQLPGAKPYITGSNVTVYAGANDVDWLSTLVSCAKTNCATTQTAAKLESRITVMKTNLERLIAAIQSEKPRRVVVNTYYALVASGDTCAVKLGVTPEETTFINTEETKLNAAIAAAGKQANANVVFVNFTGHTLCNPTPWIQSITDRAPFHPTVAGQQQIASQDATALK